eukprot:gene5647-8972_t
MAAMMNASRLSAINASPSVRSRQIASVSRRSVRANAKVYDGKVMADPTHKFAVVVSKFNSLVTKQLLEGAHETFERHGVSTDHVDVARGILEDSSSLVSKKMMLLFFVYGNFDECEPLDIKGATAYYNAVVGATTSALVGA